MKAAKDANWRCGDLFCIFLAILNIVVYLLVGRHTHTRATEPNCE
jgi:uncharacterized protein YqhQ